MAPVSDYLDELMQSDFEGLGLWLIDRDFCVIGASTLVLESLQATPDELIGKRIDEHDVIHSVSIEARIQRLETVFRTGIPDTAVFWQKLPKQGWVRIITTASKISENLILNVAHDISATENSLLWLHSTIFQKLPVLISNRHGCCIAATEGAARLCGVVQSEELIGKTIADTIFAHLIERERDLVEQSRLESRPVYSIEWNIDAAGNIHQYAVTRIALSGENWLLIMLEITDRTPYIAHSPETVRGASNLDLRLTRQQFAVLQGLWHRERREDTAERLDIKSSTVDDYRKQLKNLLGAAETRDIVSIVRQNHAVLGKVLDSLSLKH